MPRRAHRSLWLTLTALTSAATTVATAAARAQQPLTPRPARALGPITGSITEPFGGALTARHLSNGRLLVNDPARRRVLLFDSSLTTFTTVADARNTAAPYRSGLAGLVPYRGDSTLFVDPASPELRVLDPAGRVARTTPRPGHADVAALTGMLPGTPGVDARGRLVYAAPPRATRRSGEPGRTGPAAPAAPVPQLDSTPLLRVDLATHVVDTLTFVRSDSPRFGLAPAGDSTVRAALTPLIDPLPVVDAWAVLADGSVIVLRGRDFRVDLVGADGTLTRGPAVPHEWRRLSDAAKVAFLDSTRTAMERARLESWTRFVEDGGLDAARGATHAPAAPPTVTVRVYGPGEALPTIGGPSAGVAATRPIPPLPALAFVAAGELPDSVPPFAAAAARADADGNVWVRIVPTGAAPGPVYDVVDRAGTLVDRVVLPDGSVIAGFGPGVVYLARSNGAVMHLTRVRIR